MSTSPTVVVRKGGALAALISGIFGTLIVGLVCGTVVGFYALNMADRHVGELFGLSKSLVTGLPEWSESIPVLADMLADRRAPDYRDELACGVRLVDDDYYERPRALVEVTNNGEEVVTLLAARVVALSGEGIPLSERHTYIATPIMADDDEWRGPLQPGQTRRLTVRLPYGTDPNEVDLELTDIRIWTGPAETASQRRADSVARLPQAPAEIADADEDEDTAVSP